MQHPQPNNNYVQQPSFNMNYMKQPMQNPKDIFDPKTAINMALVLMAKEFKLNYSTPTHNNQRISSNPRNRQIAQPGQSVGNQIRRNAVQNQGMQNVGNQNGLIFVPAVKNKNGNVVSARAKNNARPRRRDVAYLQTQLLIPQKEEAVIQLQDEEFDLMVVVDCEEIEEVNANCILMANLHEIFNMFAQEEQYTELLEPTTDTYLMQHDDSNAILVDSIMDPSGGDSDKNPATIEETRAFYESL
ncbi:hypothetical protein Tco_1088575 [Tanacetum coccineum]